MIENFAERLTELQVKRPYIFLIVFALITIALIPGIFRLTGNVEPSLEKVLPQNIEEVKTMNSMRTQFGADMMFLVLTVEEPLYDIRDPELLHYIDILSQKIESRDYILEVDSITDNVKELNRGVIPDSDEEIRTLLSMHPMTPQFVNKDYSVTIIKIRSDTGSNAELINQVVNEINEDIEQSEQYNPGVKVEITGFNAIDKATFEIIISDFMLITLVSMILVMIVVWITFRGFVKGMLPMVVVMLALIWTMGLAGYIGFTITVVTMVAAAMIMGLGIDFGIHVVHSYFHFRHERTPKDSIREVMKELLRAMLGASLTTTAGFLALLFGVLPAMKTLGIVLGIGILSTLTGAVFILPVIVYLYDTKVNTKTK